MSEQIQRDPNKVDIYDTTGRDGLQTVGVGMTNEDRVRMSLQLESIGVDIIEAGFPASGAATTNNELEVVQSVAEAVDAAKVAALCRLEPADIENGWAGVEPGKDNSGGVRLHTFISTSEVQMNAQNLTPDKVKALTASEVARAKSFTDDVEFSPMDASRSDFELVKEVCRIAVANGATVLNIPDTTGFMTYREYGRMIAAIREDIHPDHPYVIFSAHTHGDRDLGTAAAMEAIGIGGVRQVEAAVNKLGPRLGNGDLASVVGNVREGGDPIPPGTYTNVDPSRLPETSRMVAEFSGKAALAELPFTSPNAFAHAEGIHQHDIVVDPNSFEGMEAAAYGQEAGQIVLGPLCGRTGVRKRLGDIGIELEDDELNAVTARVKEIATEQGRDLEDNDIELLAAEVTGEPIIDYYELESVDAGEKHGVAHAKVKIKYPDGKSGKEAVRLPGEGAIDAMVTAINQATDFEGGVADWQGASREPGEDAVGGVTVIVKQNGYSRRVYVEDPSVLQASAKAYMIGRNMIARGGEAKDRFDEYIETREKQLGHKA